jgi:type III pantothenate kinase
MILALDIGNSQIFGGVFDGDELIFHFRKSTQSGVTSDELGIFLKAVLRENSLDSHGLTAISICSVVPKLNHSIKNACLKYFSLNPFFLKPGTRTGLKINYRNPVEVGTDRIANAIAACERFPGQNIIVVDFGTANTFCVIDRLRNYLGGLILPGLRISK